MQVTEQSIPFSFSALHCAYLTATVQRILDYYGERLVSLAIFGSYARKEPRVIEAAGRRYTSTDRTRLTS